MVIKFAIGEGKTGGNIRRKMMKLLGSSSGRCNDCPPSNSDAMLFFRPVHRHKIMWQLIKTLMIREAEEHASNCNNAWCKDYTTKKTVFPKQQTSLGDCRLGPQGMGTCPISGCVTSSSKLIPWTKYPLQSSTRQIGIPIHELRLRMQNPKKKVVGSSSSPGFFRVISLNNSFCSFFLRSWRNILTREEGKGRVDVATLSHDTTICASNPLIDLIHPVKCVWPQDPCCVLIFILSLFFFRFFPYPFSIRRFSGVYLFI